MLSELIHSLLHKSWQAKQEQFWRKKKKKGKRKIKSRRKGRKDIFQANSVMSVRRVRFPTLSLDMLAEGWVLNCERHSPALCRAMVSGICPREVGDWEVPSSFKVIVWLIYKFKTGYSLWISSAFTNIP